MKMYTKAFNKMSELTDFVNEAGITKDLIISVMQGKDGLFILNWFGE